MSTTTNSSTTERARPAGAVPDLRYGDAEEQLRAVVRDLLADRSPLTAVLARVDAGEADDVPLWRALAADLGCAGLLIDKPTAGPGPATARPRSSPRRPARPPPASRT